MIAVATVRTGRPADRPRLRAIQAAALAEPAPAVLAAALGEGPLVLVLEADEDDGHGEGTGGVVGYVIALNPAGPIAYVPELAVHPDHHRRGYGSTLLSALLDALAERGADAVRVTVRECDRGARAFYETVGFEQVDRAPDQFASTEGLVMERGL